MCGTKKNSFPWLAFSLVFVTITNLRYNDLIYYDRQIIKSIPVMLFIIYYAEGLEKACFESPQNILQNFTSFRVHEMLELGIIMSSQM